MLLAALGYDTDTGERLIEEAVEDPEASIEMLQYRLDKTGQHEQWLRVPQTDIHLNEGKREAVMDYCHQNKVHLSDIVEQQMRTFVERVVRGERVLDE